MLGAENAMKFTSVPGLELWLRVPDDSLPSPWQVLVPVNHDGLSHLHLLS